MQSCPLTVQTVQTVLYFVVIEVAVCCLGHVKIH